MNLLDAEQISNILGVGWEAIASLPHLITDLDISTIDALEAAHGCTVGLWNYPNLLVESFVESFGPEPDDATLRDWELEGARANLRTIIDRANVSLYNRDVVIVDARSRPSELACLYDGDLMEGYHFVEDFWEAVSQAVERVGWVAIPELPNSDLIVYCAKSGADEWVDRLATIQRKMGRNLWQLPK